MSSTARLACARLDKGNAAALVIFLVFDAIADTKIRKHEPHGLTMDADTGLNFFGPRPVFFGQPFMDLCFGIETRASDEFDGLDATKNLQSL